MKKIIRIIPILDIKNGYLIKGINLEGLRILGKPNKFIKYYYNEGADEIIYADNTATLYGIPVKKEHVKSAIQNIFIPFCVGGGIKSMTDIEKMLTSGADKIFINSALFNKKKLLQQASKTFGSSNITVRIEVININNKYYLTSHNGRNIINKNPIDWAKKCQDSGAGEIILTSVNNEGLKNGFDIKINEEISSKLQIPVIAHGGAGNFNHIYDLISKTNISGVCVASLFHYDSVLKLKEKINFGNTDYLDETLKNNYKPKNNLRKLKLFLKKNNINVR